MIKFFGMCMHVDNKIKQLFEASLDSSGTDNNNNASPRTSSISFLKSMRMRSRLTDKLANSDSLINLVM